VPATLTDKDYLSQLEQTKQAQTAELIKQVLEYSRDERADFLGLGKILRSQNPVGFANIPGGWNEALGSAVFEISVTVDILMSYDIINPTVEHR
jgi:Spore germination B3/ GerAC like, C-terminal.